LIKKLPKTDTDSGTPAPMTVNELNALRIRIEDLKKLNHQLVHFRLPSLQSIVNGLHIISTSQHQQLKLALARGNSRNGDDSDDENYNDDDDNNDDDDDGSLSNSHTPEQQVQIAYRRAEDASYRYNKAKERFDGINSQFEEYNEKMTGLTTDLESNQNLLNNLREKSKVLVNEIVQVQGKATSSSKIERELNIKHAEVEGQVSAISTQLSLSSEQLINETNQFQNQTSNLTKSISTLESDLVKLQDGLKSISTAISQRNGMLRHLEDEVEKLSTLEQRCNDLKLKKLKNQSELNLFKEKESNSSKILQEYTTQLQGLDLEMKKVHMENGSKLKRITEIKNEIEKHELIQTQNSQTISTLKLKLSQIQESYHQSITIITTNNQNIQRDLQGQLDIIKHEMKKQQDDYDEIYDSQKLQFDRTKLLLQNTIQLDESKCENLDNSRDDLQKQLAECAIVIEKLRNDITTYQNIQNTQSDAFQTRFLELQQKSSELEQEELYLKQRKITQLVKRREFELQNQEFIAQDVYRRRLHNIMQDLKGNIRVLCRIRPTLPQDGGIEGNLPVQYLKGSNEIKIQVKEKEHSFQFERIFGGDSTQVDLFTEVQEIVQSAIDGYEVCLFSYGQTGSGKSHTMMGSLDENSPQQGIIPRSVALIFDNISNLKQHNANWDIKLSVSCCQIYLDKLSDLLSGSNINAKDAGDLKLINDQVNKKITVQGLTLRPVQSTQQVYKALEDAQKSRVVASTGMNATSSRSHFVFTLHVDMHNSELNEHRTGVLNLCDLAGSERINSAKTTGDQLKETQKINASLSTLNRIFLELSQNRDHISFRECKLTDLLQYCLSGDGKTLMIVNLSPAAASAQETYGSLQLAQTVSKVQRTARSEKPQLASNGGRGLLPGSKLNVVGVKKIIPTVPTPMSGVSTTRSVFAPSTAGTKRGQ
jgi:kinesin family protein C1